MRMPPDSMPVRIQRWRWMRLTERRARLMKTGKRLRNQRSKQSPKKNTHAPTTTMSFFGTDDPSKPEKLMEFHSYFSFGGNDTRSKPIFSSRGISEIVFTAAATACWWIIAVCWRKKKRKSNLPPLKLEFEAQQKPMEIQVLNDLVKYNDRLNVNTASDSTRPSIIKTYFLSLRTAHRRMKCYSRAARGPTSICGLTFKVSLSLVEFQLPILCWSTVFLENGMSISWDLWLLKGNPPDCSSGKNFFATDNRSTGLALIFRSNGRCSETFSNARTFLSTAYDIRPLLTTFTTMGSTGGPHYTLTRKFIEKRFLLLFFLRQEMRVGLWTVSSL